MTDSLRSEFMTGLDEIERATDPNAWAASSGPSNVKPRPAPESAEAADTGNHSGPAGNGDAAADAEQGEGDAAAAAADRNGASGPDRTPFSAPGTYSNEAPVREPATGGQDARSAADSPDGDPPDGDPPDRDAGAVDSPDGDAAAADPSDADRSDVGSDGKPGETTA
jgi:hypothetical protein